MKMKLCTDKTALHICTILKKSGKQCFVVGGSVRDEIMENEPDDIDITTNALPNETTQIFQKQGCKVVPTGIEHGTVTVFCDDHPSVEVTTFRLEGPYSDGRHPDWVKFVENIEQDLARRDLTINAIALDPLKCEIVDPFHGQKDIKNKVIRAVGNPIDRFTEDGLRPFRAARFHARFKFRIEPKTLKAMADKHVHETVKRVATERIRDEFVKALSTEHPRKFIETLDKTGLLYLPHVLPEMLSMKKMPQPKKFHKHDVFEHSLSALDAMSKQTKDPFLRWVALLHDIAKPEAYNNDPNNPHFYEHEKLGAELVEKIMRRMKGWSVEEIDEAKRLIRHHLIWYDLGKKDVWTDPQLRRWVNKVGDDLVDKQIMLARADVTGHGKPKGNKLDYYVRLENRINELRAGKKNVGVSIADLKVNGNDVMNELNIPPGRKVGETLEQLLDIVIEHPELNEREKLLQILRGMK